METGEFHWTNGVYFKRNADGSVRLRVNRDDADVVTENIPPAEWASIVAHVSDGGSALAYGVANALANSWP